MAWLVTTAGWLDAPAWLLGQLAGLTTQGADRAVVAAGSAGVVAGLVLGCAGGLALGSRVRRRPGRSPAR